MGGDDYALWHVDGADEVHLVLVLARLRLPHLKVSGYLRLAQLSLVVLVDRGVLLAHVDGLLLVLDVYAHLLYPLELLPLRTQVLSCVRIGVDVREKQLRALYITLG